MLELDGSIGGGQILRSALALSAITGTPFRMTAVRSQRRTPGLRPQHLACVRVMEQACNASVSEVAVGSEELTFKPGRVEGGQLEIDIETAGSTTLLFDTLLPLVTVLDRSLAITVRGGTDVRWSPPIDYYRHVKLPLCRQLGVRAAIEVDRTGFYPAGGGRATLWLSPSNIEPIDRTDRGKRTGVRTYSKASADLRAREVAERQDAAAVDRLESIDVPVRERTVTYVRTESLGSVILVRFDYEHSIAGFSALGERGRPAEEVGVSAVELAAQFERETAVVDEHMADQLVLFLGLAGGRIRIPRVTEHVESSVELVSTFGLDVSIERPSAGPELSGRGRHG